MSSSGLIYAVIVGAWAAYLVPMWLRRQDELNEARPTERFSTAIRLLSGRAALERRAERRLEDAPEGRGRPAGSDDDPQATQLLKTSRPVRPAAPAGTSAAGASPKPNPRAALLARRRRMVIVLFAAFTAGMLATAVFGIGLLWLPAVPALLFSCYIAQMRRQERRRLEAKLNRRRAAAAPPAAAPAPGPAVARAGGGAGAGGDAASQEPTTSGTGALLSADLAEVEHEDWVAGVRERQAPPDTTSTPVPAPSPTYSTKPVAPRARPRGGASAPPSPKTPLFDQYADDHPRASGQ